MDSGTKNTDGRDGMVIKRSAMIQRNKAPLDQVYSVESKPIGEGGFGVVYKCVHKETGQVRALK